MRGTRNSAYIGSPQDVVVLIGYPTIHPSQVQHLRGLGHSPECKIDEKDGLNLRYMCPGGIHTEELCHA